MSNKVPITQIYNELKTLYSDAIIEDGNVKFCIEGIVDFLVDGDSIFFSPKGYDPHMSIFYDRYDGLNEIVIKTIKAVDVARAIVKSTRDKMGQKAKVETEYIVI